MMDVFPRIRTVATGERSKALQGVVPVSVMGMTVHPGKTAQATDYLSPFWRAPRAGGIGLVRLVWEPPWHERFVAADNVNFLLVLTRRQVIFQTRPKSEVDHEHQQRHFDTLQ